LSEERGAGSEGRGARSEGPGAGSAGRGAFGPEVADELIRRNVIIDYRPGAGIRVAPHFYNTEDEIDRAVETLVRVSG